MYKAFECTDIPPLVAETVLGHQSSSTVVGLRLTSRLFERRVPVMQEWGDVLTETMEPVRSLTLWMEVFQPSLGACQGR